MMQLRLLQDSLLRPCALESASQPVRPLQAGTNSLPPTPFCLTSVSTNQSTKVLSLAHWRQPVELLVKLGLKRAASKLSMYLQASRELARVPPVSAHSSMPLQESRGETPLQASRGEVPLQASRGEMPLSAQHSQHTAEIKQCAEDAELTFCRGSPCGQAEEALPKFYTIPYSGCVISSHAGRTGWVQPQTDACLQQPWLVMCRQGKGCLGGSSSVWFWATAVGPHVSAQYAPGCQQEHTKGHQVSLAPQHQSTGGARWT